MDKEELLQRCQKLVMGNVAIGALERDAAHFAAEIGWRHRQMDLATMNQSTSLSQKQMAEINLVGMCKDMRGWIPELKNQEFEDDTALVEGVVAYCSRVVQGKQG